MAALFHGKAAGRPATPFYVSSPIPGPAFQSPTWQLPFEDVSMFDVDGGLKLAVTGVKVRRWVIIEEHTNQNSVEGADRRHSARLILSSLFAA